MENYEPVEIESQIYRNSKNTLKIFSFLVFVFGLLIIIETVISQNMKQRTTSNGEKNYSDPFIRTKYVDRCLPMRPLLAEECTTYNISENSTWRNDDDGMCSQYFLKPGDICEGDGECGTNDNLNNCGDDLDIYLIDP